MVDRRHPKEQALPALPAAPGRIGLTRVLGDHEHEVDVGEAGKEVAAGRIGPARVDGGPGLAAREVRGPGSLRRAVDEAPERTQRRASRAQDESLNCQGGPLRHGGEPMAR